MGMQTMQACSDDTACQSNADCLKSGLLMEKEQGLPQRGEAQREKNYIKDQKRSLGSTSSGCSGHLSYCF